MGVNTVIMSGNVKQGTIAVTAAQNINYAYAAINGSLSSAFDLTTDETGLIGVTHNPVNEALSYQTVIFLAGKLFAERLDGIVVSSIKPATASAGK